VQNGNEMNGTQGPEAISADTIERLRLLAGSIPPEELSEVWIFPPLEDVDGSDEFHLFTRRVGEGVFRVCAAEFAASVVARVTVYGAVPEGRVPGLVAGFRRRLGDRNDPLHLPIFGSLERWRLVVGADPAPEQGAPDGPGSGGADGADPVAPELREEALAV
jgi:hypothetical protein